MAYLNIDLSYFTHRKTCRLIGLLGRGAELLPIRLWSHCGAHHCEDGRMTDYSPQEVESVVQWWGRPGEAVEAMVKVRFLERDGDGFACHDWLEHQGHLAAFKAKGRAMALARWKGKRDADSIAASNATAPPQAMPNLTDPADPIINAKRVAARPMSRGQELYLANEELKRVEGRIKTIRDGYDRHQEKSEADKAELKTLRARQSELKKTMGWAV